MVFADSLDYSFSGHESFSLRYAWLKKGYDAIKEDANCFNGDDAIIRMGVGKNMVKSIRHWGIACGIWESRSGHLQHTRLGQSLFSDDGWDPYLDDPGTLWLLHWMLASEPSHSTSWWWLFARQKINEFGRDELIKELMELGKKQSGRVLSEATIKRDVDVLLRTYVRAKETSEDDLDCPLAQLGIVRHLPSAGQYSLIQGAHPSLPTGIVLAAILDWRRLNKSASFGLDDLLYGPGSPGRVFRLTEGTMLDHLEAICERVPQIQFSETAGIRQILIADGAPDLLTALASYYQPIGGV